MSKLKKYPIKDLFEYVVGYECPIKEIQIRMCEKSQADAIISKYHYSGKPTKNSFLSLLVYYKGETKIKMLDGITFEGRKKRKEKDLQAGTLFEN